MSLSMSRHEVTVRHLSAGIDNYVQRVEAHTLKAETLQPAPNSDGVIVWESPQQLRMSAHEHDLAQECIQAMFTCSAIRTQVQRRALAHRCYVSARSKIFNGFETVKQFVSMSLSEVAQLFATVKRSTSSPPVQLHALNVLATCHASNAPGLSPIAMNYWQVPTRE